MKKIHSVSLFMAVYLLFIFELNVNSMDYGINEVHIFKDDKEIIKKKLDMMKEAGIEWFRLSFNWAEIERSTNVFTFEKDWTKEGECYYWSVFFDTVIKESAKRGIRILGLLCYVPNCWVYPNFYIKDCKDCGVHDYYPPNYWDNEQYKKWENYIKAVVERYDGDDDWGSGGEPDWNNDEKQLVKDNPITHWQVWNEPDIEDFWPSFKHDFKTWENTQSYVEILKQSYKTIKNCYAEPNGCRVLGGGLSKLDWEYIELLYVHGADKYFDIFAIHPYRCWFHIPRGPDEKANDDHSTLRADLERLKNNYIKNKPIWITEMGWNTSGENAVSECTQAIYLMRTYNIAKSLGFIENVFWYNLKDNPDNSGILRSDYSKKPSFYTYQFITGKQSFDEFSKNIPNGIGSIIHNDISEIMDTVNSFIAKCLITNHYNLWSRN